MGRLPRRYNEWELETLVMCVKPVEKWSSEERKAWAKDRTGFRHFAAPNVVPFEHYLPRPRPTYFISPQHKPAA